MGIWAEQLWNSDTHTTISKTVVGKLLCTGFWISLYNQELAALLAFASHRVIIPLSNPAQGDMLLSYIPREGMHQVVSFTCPYQVP